MNAILLWASLLADRLLLSGSLFSRFVITHAIETFLFLVNATIWGFLEMSIHGVIDKGIFFSVPVIISKFNNKMSYLSSFFPLHLYGKKADIGHCYHDLCGSIKLMISSVFMLIVLVTLLGEKRGIHWGIPIDLQATDGPIPLLWCSFLFTEAQGTVLA